MSGSTVTRRRAATAATLVALVALLTLLLPPPLPAHAETTLRTPWPVVEVEPGSEVTIELEVTAADQRVDLAVVEAPDDWDTLLRAGGFVVRAVTGGDEEEPAEVDLEVTVPVDAPEGTSRLTLEATAADGTSDRLDVDLVVAEEVAGAVTLDTEFPELSGAVDDDFGWSLELGNALPGETTFALQAVGPSGWLTSARPSGEPQATTVTVPGGETETIDVDAEPPANVEAGTYELQVVATGGGQRVEVELAAVVEGTVSLELSTPDERLNAEGPTGQATRVPLLLTNAGAAPLEEVQLSAEPPADWDVAFEPETVTGLAPGDTVEVTAEVTPSDDAIAGDYTLDVEAEADGRTDELTIRFSVRTPLGWGAVGLGTILVALASLGAVFRIFGRR